MVDNIIQTLREFKMYLYLEQMKDEGIEIYDGGIIDSMLLALKHARVVSIDESILDGCYIAYSNVKETLYLTTKFKGLNDTQKAVSFVAAYVNNYIPIIDNHKGIKKVMEMLMLDSIMKFNELPKNNVYTVGINCEEYLKHKNNIKLQIDDITKICVVTDCLAIERSIYVTFQVKNFYYNTKEKMILTPKEEKEFIENTEVLEALNDEIRHYTN